MQTNAHGLRADGVNGKQSRMLSAHSKQCFWWQWNYTGKMLDTCQVA